VCGVAFGTSATRYNCAQQLENNGVLGGVALHGVALRCVALRGVAVGTSGTSYNCVYLVVENSEA